MRGPRPAPATRACSTSHHQCSAALWAEPAIRVYLPSYLLRQAKVECRRWVRCHRRSRLRFLSQNTTPGQRSCEGMTCHHSCQARQMRVDRQVIKGKGHPQEISSWISGRASHALRRLASITGIHPFLSQGVILRTTILSVSHQFASRSVKVNYHRCEPRAVGQLQAVLIDAEGGKSSFFGKGQAGPAILSGTAANIPGQILILVF